MTNLSSHSEKELLLRIAAGDEHAFRLLFDTYRSKLYTYLLKVTESPDLAEDGVHDIFLKIWSRKEQLPEILNANAYLYRMAHNHALNGLRKMAKETLLIAELEKTPTDNGENPGESLVRKEVRQFIHDSVRKLTPQQQAVFNLSRESGLKQEEIAHQLGISIFTVKKHLTDALNVLRKEINQHYGSQAVALYVLFHLSL